MLKRLFIKDYTNTNDPNVRNQYGKVAGIFGIITNLILGIFYKNSYNNSFSYLISSMLL